MADNVFCPWCGSPMLLHFTPASVKAWYECRACGAQSPHVAPDWANTATWKGDTLAAAQNRWKEPRKPIDLADIKWLGVPYFAEYKGLDKLFLYVTGNGISADFAAARELGWTGKVLKELFDWEDEHSKLSVRLWECQNSPPTAEERTAAKWEGE